MKTFLSCAAVAAALLLSSTAFAAQTHGPRAKHSVRKAERVTAPIIIEKSETTLRDVPPKTIIRLPGNESPQTRFASLDVQLLDSIDAMESSTSLCEMHRVGPRDTIRRCR